jgi:hypothetical protein
MMRPPERVVWSPHRVDQEDAWISEDGVWVLILRAQLDQLRAGQPTEEIRIEDPSVPIRFSDPDPTVRVTRKFTPEEVAAVSPQANPAQAPAPRAEPADRSRPFLAISAVVLALAAGAWMGMSLERTRVPPAAAPIAAPGTATAPSASPSTSPPTPPEAQPAEAPVPQPKPPTPRPAPIRPITPAEQGWAVVERNPSYALQHFQESISKGGGLNAAHGYGYALLKLGRAEEAKPYLCRARALGGDTRREIEVLLARNGLTCD